MSPNPINALKKQLIIQSTPNIHKYISTNPTFSKHIENTYFQKNKFETISVYADLYGIIYNLCIWYTLYNLRPHTHPRPLYTPTNIKT